MSGCHPPNKFSRIYSTKEFYVACINGKNKPTCTVRTSFCLHCDEDISLNLLPNTQNRRVPYVQHTRYLKWSVVGHKLAPQRPLSSPFPCTPPRLNQREGKRLELWPRQVLKLSCPCKKGCALHFNMFFKVTVKFIIATFINAWNCCQVGRGCALHFNMFFKATFKLIIATFKMHGCYTYTI